MPARMSGLLKKHDHKRLFPIGIQMSSPSSIAVAVEVTVV